MSSPKNSVDRTDRDTTQTETVPVIGRECIVYFGFEFDVRVFSLNCMRQKGCMDTNKQDWGRRLDAEKTGVYSNQTYSVLGDGLDPELCKKVHVILRGYGVVRGDFRR